MKNLLFSLINFAALFGVGYYFFKRYLWDIIKRQMAYEKLSFEALHKQQEELKKEEKNLIFQGQRQQSEYEDLRDKISQWNHHVAHREEQHAREEEALMQAMQQRHERFVHDQKIIAFHTKVMPEAIRQAEEELQKKFATDASARDAYMKPIFTFMRTSDTEELS